MTANSLAAYIVKYSLNKKKPITNLKLQKLLWFVNLFYYVEKNEFIFEPVNKNKFQAWTYGPVVPCVYYKYANAFTYNSISAPLDDCPNSSDFSAIDLTILNKILDILIEKSASRLVDLSHIVDSPWFEAMKSEQKDISVESIIKYTQKLKG